MMITTFCAQSVSEKGIIIIITFVKEYVTKKSANVMKIVIKINKLIYNLTLLNITFHFVGRES